MKKVNFNEISIGTRFWHDGKEFEKTGVAKGGCCNKSYNCFCISTESPHIFSRKHTVEIKEETDQ